MDKDNYEKLINFALNNGAKFVEIYYEETYRKNYEYINSKLDTIKTNNRKGIGIRIINNKDYYYCSTDVIEYNNIEKLLKKMLTNINNKSMSKANCKLCNIKEMFTPIRIRHNELSTAKKIEILRKIDKKIRNKYEEITQVNLKFAEDYKIMTIANSEGNFITTDSIHTRYICQTFAEKDDVKESEFTAIGRRKGYEFLEDFDIEKISLENAKSNIEKLSAKNFKGGIMPVVIASGFGAVIFHEACGHGLEATSVAPKLSVFSNMLGKKVASNKVTLIDNGRINGAWGSNYIDDEGEETRKIKLIENGILKNYLIDRFSSIIMKKNSNGCARRESYEYAPTSRMSNTYLEAGNDSIEDMIKSIEYGLYCKKLSGGQVNTTTGDFNFGVEAGYLIEKGKITKRVKGMTLIGNGKEILKNVEMVGNDLEINDGYCGSKSGMIHVTCGQPTIKISEILVGGKE